MDMTKEFYELKLDHKAEGFKECFGIDENLDNECLKIAKEARNSSKYKTEAVEKVWNCDKLSFQSRLYTIYKMAEVEGVQHGLEDVAKITSKLLSYIIKQGS